MCCDKAEVKECNQMREEDTILRNATLADVLEFVLPFLPTGSAAVLNLHMTSCRVRNAFDACNAPTSLIP
jgi:hypothetical protein